LKFEEPFAQVNIQFIVSSAVLNGLCSNVFPEILDPKHVSDKKPSRFDALLHSNQVLVAAAALRGQQKCGDAKDATQHGRGLMWMLVIPERMCLSVLFIIILFILGLNRTLYNIIV
jgi:hypothetical protein